MRKFFATALAVAALATLARAEGAAKAPKGLKESCIRWLNASDPRRDAASAHPERVAACVAGGGPPKG